MSANRVRGLLKYRSYLAVIAVWAAILFVILIQYRALDVTSRNLNELMNGLDNLRNTISFNAPYRTSRANDIALNIQVLHALRVQLEADSSTDGFQPDLTQTLYLTDRFINQMENFLTVELSVNDLVERLQMLRERYAAEPQWQADYLKIGAYLLQALYTGGARSPELYRTFDAILKSSESLPQGAKHDMQKTLAQVSVLLSHYAEGDHLVDKLLRHRVHNEILLVNAQYQQRFKMLSLVSVVCSVMAVLMVFWLSVKREAAAGIHPPSAVEADTETKATPDQREAIVTSLEERGNNVVTEDRTAAINLQQMLASLNDDYDSVQMLLEVFVEDHRHDDEDLRRLLNSDLESAQRKAHSLKGVAGNLGAEGLREIALTIEMKLKQGALPTQAELQTLTLQLKRAIDSARDFLIQRTS